MMIEIELGIYVSTANIRQIRHVRGGSSKKGRAEVEFNDGTERFYDLASNPFDLDALAYRTVPADPSWKSAREMARNPLVLR